MLKIEYHATLCQITLFRYSCTSCMRQVSVHLPPPSLFDLNQINTPNKSR